MLIWHAHSILHALQGSLMGPSNNQKLCHALRNAIMATLCTAHLIVNGGVELAGGLTSIVGLCLSHLETKHCRGVGLHHQDLQGNTLPLSLIPPSISRSWICVAYSEAQWAQCHVLRHRMRLCVGYMSLFKKMQQLSERCRCSLAWWC